MEGKFSFIFGPGNGSESTAEREEVGGNVCHDVTGCIRRHARARVCMCICPAPLGFWARALLFIMRSASKGYLGTRNSELASLLPTQDGLVVHSSDQYKKKKKEQKRTSLRNRCLKPALVWCKLPPRYRLLVLLVSPETNYLPRGCVDNVHSMIFLSSR